MEGIGLALLYPDWPREAAERRRLCFPGNGILRPETNTPNRSPRFHYQFAEAVCLRESPQIRAYLAATGGPPVAWDCVVADAVGIEPISYPNSLVTGKFTGNFVEGGALAGSRRYNHT